MSPEAAAVAGLLAAGLDAAALRAAIDRATLSGLLAILPGHRHTGEAMPAKRPYHVLVCGGRDYANRRHVFDTLDAIHAKAEITTVIQGGAKGADSLAASWANARRVPCWEFPADWNRYGKRAGYVRNAQMLDVGTPDLVVAFPGGHGTAMMCDLAGRVGIPIQTPDRDLASIGAEG